MLGTLFSAAYLATAAWLGVSIVRRFAPFLSGLERFAYGSVLGIVVVSLVLLPLGRFPGLSGPLVGLVAVAAGLAAVTVSPGSATAGAWLARAPQLGGEIRPTISAALRHAAWLPVVVIGLLAFRWLALWSGALVYEEGALVAGHINIWGDWPVHLGILTSFTDGANFPPEDPRFAGRPLAYHYLTSLTAAGMVMLGMDPAAALSLHSFASSILVAISVYAFARRLTGDVAASAVTVMLFFLGGSLGWWVMAQQSASAADPVAALLARPWNSGEVGEANFRWQNMYYGFIVSQRAFLYGLPIALLCLTLLLHGVRERATASFLFAGVVAGLLPLAHLSTLGALALVTPYLFAIFPSRRWIYFFASWILVALPQVLLQHGGGAGPLAATRIQLGWIAGSDLWPVFWLKQVGLFLPLALVALFTRSLLPSPSRSFLAGFMAIFVITNVIVFQPWDWDNHRFLVYWFLATTILVAALLVRWWRATSAAGRAWIVVAVATMLASGVLEDLNQLLGRDRYPLASPEEVALARRVRDATDPEAVFVVGLQNNHPVPMLAGRRVVMSYPGWLWTHGLPYASRERDVRDIYAGNADIETLLQRYRVSYIVVGPNEREALGASEEHFRDRYAVVVESESYVVFDVRRGTARIDREELPP
jgi:hypothetical protein